MVRESLGSCETQLFPRCKRNFLYDTGHIACMQVLRVLQKSLEASTIRINLVVCKSQGHRAINEVFWNGFFSFSNTSIVLLSLWLPWNSELMFPGSAPQNSGRFFEAWGPHLKPDFVHAVPHHFFCVTSTLQLLIVNFSCHFITLAARSCNVLLQLCSLAFGFCYPEKHFIIWFFFTRLFIPFSKSLVNKSWQVPRQIWEVQCSSYLSSVKTTFCHLTILMQTFQIE